MSTDEYQSWILVKRPEPVSVPKHRVKEDSLLCDQSRGLKTRFKEQNLSSIFNLWSSSSAATVLTIWRYDYLGLQSWQRQGQVKLAALQVRSSADRARRVASRQYVLCRRANVSVATPKVPHLFTKIGELISQKFANSCRTSWQRLTCYCIGETVLTDPSLTYPLHYNPTAQY